MHKTDHNSAGFGILEVLIALAIGLIVIASLGTAFLSQSKAYGVQDQVVEMVQTARAAMDIMGREIMMAGYNPSKTPGFAGIPYNANPSVIDIYADLDGDGSTTGTNEHITYAFNPSTFQITRNTHTGGRSQPFAENITAFSVGCYKGYKEGTVDPEDYRATATKEIRQIRIALTVRTRRADRDFASDNGYRTHTLTSNFIPRNLNL